MNNGETPRFNIDEPRYDQRHFLGRLRYFAEVTDPRTVFTPTRRLLEARNLVQQHRRGEEPPSTSPAELYTAQRLYKSAFHPDSGQLNNVVGRMSFQVYGGTILCGAMMIWYRSTAAVVFWQWANQSFNALVNYTNRNAKSEITTRQLLVAYISATSSALVTAIGLKHYLTQRAGNLLQRLVPLAAVYAANCVNIPLMRQNELAGGIWLSDEKDEHVCHSRIAALKAVTLVTISRLVIVTPTMLLIPMVMERLEKVKWFLRKKSTLNIPIQLSLTFILFGTMVPVGCAVFPQRSRLSIDTLKRFEPTEYARAVSAFGADQEKLPHFLYFNKGL